ncbi:uncharacterized protein JCM15063_003676 [Sporobolomyces koalae]|uniref:uncharacterized protein n=1 Tax=Sporobolomyces koalae TaxID=500713 RepID=UPI003181B88D
MAPLAAEPSLLSRLSPLPPNSQQFTTPTAPHHSLPAPSREPLSQSQSLHASGLAIAHAAVRAASGEAAGQAFLSTSTSPRSYSSISRSFKSPKSHNGPHSARVAAEAGTQLSSSPSRSLPRAQPIPPNRGTNSSRWATSPATTSPNNRIPPSHPVQRGFSPVDSSAIAPESFPTTIQSARKPTVPALGQLEAAFSELRTGESISEASRQDLHRFSSLFTASAMPSDALDPTPGQSSGPHSGNPQAFGPFSAAASPPQRLSASKPHSPIVSQPARDRHDLSSGTQNAKRPALGGKSRWARDSDEEPEPIAFPSVKQAQPEPLYPRTDVSALPSRQESESGKDRDVAQKNANVQETSLASKLAQPSSLAASPPPSPLPRSGQALSETPVAAPVTEPAHHIDWADDDDNELPDLDDWGIEMPPPPAETVPVAPPSQPPVIASTSAANNRTKASRRRRSLSAKTPIASSDLVQRVPPQTAPQGRPPPSGTNRLFNSARMAAIPAAPAAPLSKQLPPHQKPQPNRSHEVTKPPPPVAPSREPAMSETSWRAKSSGPSSALFSKLSGMGGPRQPAALTTSEHAESEGGGSGGNGRGGRRSRRDRTRTSSSNPDKQNDAGDTTWTKVTAGGKGSQASRWA